MNQILTITLAVILLGSTVFAGDKPAHKTIAGPKGGRFIEVEGGHAEFYVQPDRKVSVTFYDKDLKAQSPAEQVIMLTAQAPTRSTKLEFEKSADAFLSKGPLPDGAGYMLVLQIKAKADAKPQNLRIKLDLANCGGCKRVEYGCICGGHNH